MPASPVRTVLSRLFGTLLQVTPILALAGLLLLGGGGCSLNRMVLRKAAGALSGGSGTVFAGDDDPELIADALPFALKMHESLLEGLPDDVDLLLATGSAFCSYAWAFIHLGADTLSDVHIERKTAQLQRAKKMYLRARGYLLRALDVRYPGFSQLALSGNADSALSLVRERDTTLLYWTANAWMGAFATDKFDMALSVSTRVPVAFMQWVLDTNEGFGRGSVHDFFISWYGGLPASMGGSRERARHHYERSLELSAGRAATHIALATSVAQGEQNEQEFVSLLNAALALPTTEPSADRLVTVLNQRKARWLLANREQFFLPQDINGEWDE